MTRRQTCSEKSALKNLQDLLLLMRALPAQDRLEVTPCRGVADQGVGVRGRLTGAHT
ncbi:hypothetical protein [Streptomyces fagopyri]|uniref:hypothetical protein n=1 Tax=Streptomyces fagopyri TaxID=2662397 RepID=UPI0033DC26DA